MPNPPKPRPENQEVFELCLKRINELKRDPLIDQLNEYKYQWETDLAITVWNRKWKQEYRKRVLCDYEKHVRDDFNRHNQAARDERWLLPSFANFRNKRGRPQDPITQQVYSRIRELDAQRHTRTEIARVIGKEYKRSNPTQDVRRALGEN